MVVEEGRRYSQWIAPKTRKKERRSREEGDALLCLLSGALR